MHTFRSQPGYVRASEVLCHLAEGAGHGRRDRRDLDRRCRVERLGGLSQQILVFGSESHRLIGEGGAAAFTQNAGFNGIVAALFGGLHPLTTIPASFFFGGMLTGGIALQRELQVPAALIVALNGVVVVFVVGSLKLRSKTQAWADRVRRSEASA